MRRETRRWIVVAGVAVLVTAGAASSPHALRRVEAFRIVRIEVSGARYLTPQQASVASGITAESTLFDEFAPWQAALEQHPLVRNARFGRRLPEVLVIKIEEAEPVAFVGTPELRALDARGRLLPIDLAAADLDLPLLVGKTRLDSVGRVTDERMLQLIDTLERLRVEQPWLLAWVSELEPMTGGARLRLRWPHGAELLLPPAPDAQRLEEVRLAIADLAGAPAEARPSAAGAGPVEAEQSELARVLRIDARFRDQVVVTVADASTVRRRGGS